jgi:hypothetical protein
MWTDSSSVGILFRFIRLTANPQTVPSLVEKRTSNVVQELKATVAYQEKQIEALTAGLQEVRAQVEMSRPAPQMALDDQ